MKNSNDLKIWKDISSTITVQELIGSYKNPSGFQKELAIFLRNLLKSTLKPASIEVGSSFGITTALLPNEFDKTILDFDKVALDKGKQLFEEIGQNVQLLHMDMFDLNKLNFKYDLVFNAGVLEHFSRKERRAAIVNMTSITKEGGHIVIAVPNHCSIPYRVGYIYSNLFGKWLYPRELKLHNFKQEVMDISGLQWVKEESFDKENIYHYLPWFLKLMFKVFDKIFNYEGYLKVFVIKKSKK